MARKPGTTGTLLASALLAAALVLPAGAAATVTIGSNLKDPATNVVGGPGTWGIGSLPPGSTAPGGTVSPVNGVVTTWRISWGNHLPLPVNFRVIKPLASGAFTGAGTGPVQMPVTNAISTLSVNLPISIGDRIGHDSGLVGLENTDSALHYLPDQSTASMLAFFNPQLADGDPGRFPPPDYAGVEVLVNADVEPTSAFEPGKAKSLNGGKVKLSLTLPNPGRLAVSGKALKRVNRTISAPGPITLKLKPSKSTRARLQRGGFKAKLLVSFTPMGGTAASQKVKVRLKP